MQALVGNGQAPTLLREDDAMRFAIGCTQPQAPGKTARARRLMRVSVVWDADYC